MGLLDFLFPKYCIYCKKFGSYVCDNCFAKISFFEGGSCLVCQRSAIGGVTHPTCRGKYMIDGCFSSLLYHGVTKRLVYSFKYKPFLTSLQYILNDFFYEGLCQKEHFYRILQQEAVFVPIPLHISRFRHRGYNQSQLLAKGLAKRFSLPLVDCLQRIKKTQTQVGLTKDEREENIKGAFAVKKQATGKIHTLPTVLLVDDVVTSGATLKEAAKVLKKAGVKSVWGVTLAHGGADYNVPQLLF